jgi:pimeloyl-ACP methyl ester carboxylesterase
LPELQKSSRRLRFTFLVVLALTMVWGAAFYGHPLWFYDHAIRVWLRLEGAKSAYIRLGPYRIHYLVAGEGRPLVLVHGLGGGAEDWALWIPPLAKLRYRVYAIDLLGFGRSDRPDVDYSIALQTGILEQFFDGEHIRQADLGGWSMGGWIALKFTLDHPQRVRRLFVCDSAGINFEPRWPRELFSAKTPAQLDQFVAILTPRRIRIPHFVARDWLRQIARESWIVQRALASMWTRADVLDGNLGKITQPVLILWGKEDATTPLSLGEEMHREMPQSVLAVFEGCGHLAPVECRRQLLGEAGQFLKADPPLPGGTHEFPLRN